MGTSCQAQKSERFKVVAKVSNSSHGKIYIANYHGRIVTIKIYTKNCNKAYSGKVLTYRTFQKRAHIIREIIPWDLRSEIFQFFWSWSGQQTDWFYLVQGQTGSGLWILGYTIRISLWP